jgi:hypothetical protein
MIGMPGPFPHLRTVIAALALSLLAPFLGGRASAQTVIGYDYNAERTYVRTHTHAWRRQDVYTNETRRYAVVTFESREESCYAWSVSQTVVARFSLGAKRSACTVSAYSRSARLAPGATKTLYRQRVESESEYRLWKIAIFSDGPPRPVSFRYAYLDEHWENHRIR